MAQQIVVQLEGEESIVVRTDGARHIVLEHPGRWRQRLTRQEAWELSEGLDEVATGRPEEPEQD